MINKVNEFATRRYFYFVENNIFFQFLKAYYFLPFEIDTPVADVMSTYVERQLIV